MDENLKTLITLTIGSFLIYFISSLFTILRSDYKMKELKHCIFDTHEASMIVYVSSKMTWIGIIGLIMVFIYHML